MQPRLAILGLALTALTLSAAADDEKPAADGKKVEEVSFAKNITPLLTNYCYRCHAGEKPKGGINLDGFKDEAAAVKNREIWERVIQNVRSGVMPPEGRKKPKPAEIEQLMTWFDVKVAKVDCHGPKDPGRVTMRRLNRVEYNNTIRDLVGVDFKPAEDFPSDDVGYGFDNIGDVLSMPPILMEKYLAAAEKIVDAAWKSADALKRILVVELTDRNKTEAARKIIETFARQAYRRPLRNDELDRLCRFVKVAEDNGDSFETGLQVALQAVLVSPHFLFRLENDRNPKDPTAIYTLNDFELASRLSYFIWSSMPDQALFDLAREGALRKDGNLEGQVKRMLVDPKARALVDNFAGQWLQLRSLKSATPDPGCFPAFSEALREAMETETELFFEFVMRDDRSILEFLDADYTFVNGPLAKHYGIPGVKGDAFQRVYLTDGRRGGILTHGSILTITSNPTRTSPVKRGKYILENILGTPPPPPPPDAGELSEDKAVIESAPLRQRMEQHRTNPNCAVCHQRMDVLGFAFENFDAIGAWREKDGKFPIDPAGVLPGGQAFKTPGELRTILKSKEEEFRRCLVEKMLTYSLGRGVEYYDKCALDQISTGMAKNGNKFSSLVIEIVKSDPFQKRRGQRGGK